MFIFKKLYNLIIIIINSVLEGRQMRAKMYMSAHGIEGQKLESVKIKNNS